MQHAWKHVERPGGSHTALDGKTIAAVARMSLASSSGDRVGSVPGADAVRAISWTAASLVRGRWLGIVDEPAIHQRSRYLAETGFPALGRFAPQLAQCAPCTVLTAGKHMWERVCGQPRRHTGQLPGTADSEQESIYVELLGLS